MNSAHHGKCGHGCIDVHYHLFPPKIIESDARAAKMFSGIPKVIGWTAQDAVDEMDEDGVATSVLSFPVPTLFGERQEDYRALARACNDYYAGLVARHPGRFGMFAGLPPLNDVEGALREIEYAFDELDADGVCILTVYKDLWLGDPAFDPVWSELNRRKAVVFVHPDMPDCCSPLKNFAAMELPFDTARTAQSMWQADILGRYPDVRIILSHGGGALPMIAGRLLDRIVLPGESGVATASEGLDYFKGFYFDTANAATAPALAGTLALAGADRIMFGTDFPFVSVSHQIDLLRQSVVRSQLGESDLDAILSENARAIMPRLV